MQEGADPWKAAQFLAMSLETLLRVYGHHRPDSSADIHRALSAKESSRREAVAQPVADQEVKSAKYWSEWQDLNLRPPRPERGALPG
jgi:hypothetical protein